MVDIGNAPVPKVPRHCYQVNCFQQGMLEFEGPMGQCFSRFPTVSSKKRGGGGKEEEEKKKEERYGIDRKCE